MGSAGPPQVILFDYQYAPNAQKARNLLNITGVPYTICEQPFVQPRPILQNLGIKYRRVPVNAIGRDVYVDNRVFLDAVLSTFSSEPGVQKLVRSPADQAFEAFGYRMFWNILDILPDAVLNDEMISDREHLFAALQRPDYREVRPSALAAFRSWLDIIEHEFLADEKSGPWINGANPGVADLHTVWIPKFALETLSYKDAEGLELGPQHYPRLHKWLAGFTTHVPENEKPKISGDEASQKVVAAGYAAPDIGVDESDPIKIAKGENVTVETTDDCKPSNMLQPGVLVGLNRKEIVIELENGLRIHFPRIGYAVKKA